MHKLDEIGYHEYSGPEVALLALMRQKLRPAILYASHFGTEAVSVADAKDPWLVKQVLDMRYRQHCLEILEAECESGFVDTGEMYREFAATARMLAGHLKLNTFLMASDQPSLADAHLYTYMKMAFI